MQSALAKFLAKNTVKSADGLPLVHTTRAYDAKRIVAADLILPSDCPVFKGEKLSYFFYGRPSYKRSLRKSQIAKYWELPSVFIFEYKAIPSKRVYPFDTGAFSNQRYPDFIQIMPMEEFEATSTIDAPQKIVGSFFIDSNRYFRLDPRSRTDFMRRFDVGVDDEEILALQELMVAHSEKSDDRRAAIEVQTDVELKLNKGEFLAVVFPEEYVESDAFMDKLEALEAEPLPYSTSPLKQEMYYSTIYTIIFDFYRAKRFIR